MKRRRCGLARMQPFSLGRLLTGAGGTDSGSNLAERKLGLVFATIAASAG